jgi:signal transduction histidine kinase
MQPCSTIQMNEVFIDNRLFLGLPVDLLRTTPIREIEFGAGEVIFDEGTKGSSLMLVGSGRVLISKIGRQGQQEVLTTIEPNDFFGEFSVMDHGPRSARAIAMEPSLLGELDRPTFNQLIQAAPDILPANFMRTVIERLRDSNSRFIEQLLQTERMTILGTMVSSIIHDFKNPMSAILSSAEFLERKAPTEPVQKLARIIHGSATRMLQMSEELLDFARGTIRLHPQPTSARRLLELLEEEILNQVRSPSLKIEVHLETIESLIVDESRLVRCLANIVKNAKEAVGETGFVTIRVSDVDPNMHIAVSDDGPGVPDEIRGRIFEPFVTHGKKDGTGLGMAIAKSTVDAHGGRIWLESEPGKGTTFYLVVPKQIAI